jgi:hypothetical protein
MKTIPLFWRMAVVACGGWNVTAAAQPPANALPPAIAARPWGVYAWGAAKKHSVPADMPVRGIPLSWRWAQLEPARGRFAFDEEVRRPLEEARARGSYLHIMMWVAPNTPEWVYAAGVPRVIVPERISPARVKQKPEYPYYFDPLYQQILHATIRALGDYLAALPPGLKERIIFIQVAEGSTGDGQPYKGVPVEAKYRIQDAAWNNYRRQTWAYYQSVFQRADGSLNIPLLVNGDANTAVENQWLLDHCAVFGVKQGMFSHGYLVSDTVQRVARWEEFRAEARTKGRFIFSRGEQDEEWHVCGWAARIHRGPFTGPGFSRSTASSMCGTSQSMRSPRSPSMRPCASSTGTPATTSRRQAPARFARCVAASMRRTKSRSPKPNLAAPRKAIGTVISPSRPRTRRSGPGRAIPTRPSVAACATARLTIRMTWAGESSRAISSGISRN